MINPPIREPVRINVVCQKCKHTADITLTVKHKRHTDKLICSKCGAKGRSLLLTYLDIPENS